MRKGPFGWSARRELTPSSRRPDRTAKPTKPLPPVSRTSSEVAILLLSCDDDAVSKSDYDVSDQRRSSVQMIRQTYNQSYRYARSGAVRVNAHTMRCPCINVR